jgi:O-antigen ligase
MLYLLTAIDNRRKRRLALTGFFLAVAMMLATQGKTSLASFFILLCVLPIYIAVKQNYKLQIFLYTVLVLLGGAAVIWSAVNLETIVVQGLGKDMTFNGRIEVWNLTIQRGLERPWLGYGYVGFWPSDYSLIVLNNTWGSIAKDVGVRFRRVRIFTLYNYLPGSISKSSCSLEFNQEYRISLDTSIPSRSDFIQSFR